MLTLGPIAALLAFSVAAAYGAWRFWRAHALTGSRLSLVASVTSLLAPLSALSFATLDGGGSHLQAGLPAVGAVATAGFALSRARRFAPMTVGLWLPSAVARWRKRDGAPLATLLEAVLGPSAAAHASRTAALAESLAEQLSIPPAEADDLVLAALVHAIGTPLIAAGDIACPPGAAARAAAANVLRRVPGCEQLAGIVAAAGECWDGSGPLGLSGESLPLAARVLAVAEAFDRASEDGLAVARAAIREGSGTLYDPVVVSEVLYLYRERSATA